MIGPHALVPSAAVIGNCLATDHQVESTYAVGPDIVAPVHPPISGTMSSHEETFVPPFGIQTFVHAEIFDAGLSFVDDGSGKGKSSKRQK